MNRSTEVLVVGAGPTGLTLATLLYRLGVRCLVIDKAAGPSTTSKALGLQYRVSELLSWLGLFERFAARAAEQTTVTLLFEGRPIARLVMHDLPRRSGTGAFTPRPLILPQSETETLLGAALREAGGSVEWSRELVDCADAGERVHATLADGDTIDARFLVSCEGAHSVARKRAGIAFSGSTFPHDFIMADVAIDTTLQHGQAYSWLHPDGIVSAITLPGERRWRLFIEAGERAEAPVTLDEVRALYAERTGDRTSRIADPTWLTRFKIHSRMVERFSRGRVFVAGDAAHLHSPSGGQGITTGMQDAYNLGWKLAQVLRRGAPESLLDSYDEERRPIARAVLDTTERNTKIFFATGPLGKWLRNHVFMPLLGTRRVQRRLLVRLSQLDMNHRRSSLSRQLGRRRVQAGDRAPDVILQGTPPVALFTLLRELRFVALSTGEDDGLGRALRALGIATHSVAADGDFTELYGARPGDLWLIRPDGYVGLRCPAARRGAIVEYLERLWPRHAVARAFATPPPQLIEVTSGNFRERELSNPR